MRKIEIGLYSYKELNNKAKRKVFSATIQQLIDEYLVEVPILDKNGDGVSEKVTPAMKRADEMRTPWFAGQYICEGLGDDEIEDMIEAQGEIFLESGDVFAA